LTLLQERQKWLLPQRNIAVGDIVLIADKDSPRNHWPMGKVVDVCPDKMGLVRVAHVKTQTSTYQRPVTKLVSLLEVQT
jgi:hypothetical protein